MRKRRWWILAAFLLAVTLLCAVALLRREEPELDFMGSAPEIARLPARWPKEFFIPYGPFPRIEGIEIVYRASFDQSLTKARAALPRLGFGRATELMPGWWLFEKPDGEMVSLIKGDRLGASGRSNRDFTSIVLDRQRGAIERFLDWIHSKL